MAYVSHETDVTELSLRRYHALTVAHVALVFAVFGVFVYIVVWLRSIGRF